MTSPAESARTHWSAWRLSVARPVALALRIWREHRFSRFIVVGGLNAVVGYGLFLLALAIMPTSFSALVAANILAILFNFRTIGSFVFGARDLRLLAPFFGVYVVAFLHNWIGLMVFESIGVRPWVAGILLQPGAVAISYLLNRRFVFGAAA
jgi:putative flippase GtrA